ncbi:MAG: RT0821/Lpp0805 family surface protein [Beijerinckiaceae bacterium]|nr:RT0821/Lpp0805 family surface protein [Beijerinckiaceae bacterium]
MIRFLMLAAVASCLGGCSTVFPLPSFISSDDVTGSIHKSPSPLSKKLDAEDWRRAHAALGVALDPQGNGASVSWSNPLSGMKGSFVPISDAYPRDDRICRVFMAEIGAQGSDQVQGTGCRDRSGEWAVSDVKPKPRNS